jgi:iron complex outermembrane receptor protein
VILRSISILLATIVFALPAPRAYAQAAAIHETVVVTGTAAPTPLGNLGRALTVISRDEIERLPVAAVDDLLRLIASVDTRSRGARGVQSDFGIRGAGFGQTLVLLNGARLNDVQSGHHNADIPVSLADVERVEVLLGAGSSLHGADAFGGTINIITRRAGPRLSAGVAVGQHRLFESNATVALARASTTHTLSGAFGRSSGFMPARDHNTRLARYQAAWRSGATLGVAYLDKEFGANGFYGPAPSREWTDQLLTTAQRRFAGPARWSVVLDAAYRTHGDRFVYDVSRPALSDNRHRTHAISADVRGHYAASERTTLSVGAGGGGDAIGSSNLGDHQFARGSLFAELRHAVRERVLIHPGVRFDTYTGFGTSWSPSVAVSAWISPHVKWRASGGRAFRVPTFTELYYRDPNHQAAGALVPEAAWSADAGLDAFRGPWSASLTAFSRWEEDVIDWVRASPAERWRTVNIRHVDTQGIEVSFARRAGRLGHLGVQYAAQRSEAGRLELLSKYVLDYPRHSLAASASQVWRGVSFGQRLEFKRRADGRRYWPVDLRAACRRGRGELFIDATNILDTSYEEIRGVAMPGRWVRVGIRIASASRD